VVLKGRWRLFRHDAGRVAGPPAWAYVALFLASLAIGHWTTASFGAVAVWVSNGVLAAAFLQLHRREAIAVAVACFAANLLSNVFRGDPSLFVGVNAVLNLGEAMLVAVLARRVCGAALDMRRPGRLLRFAFLAVTPAVGLSAVVAIGLLYVARPVPAPVLLFFIQTYLSVEVLGLLLATPALLMFARAHRFRGAGSGSRLETTGLFVLMIVVTVGVFTQGGAPILFVALLPLVLIALRLSPPLTACAMVAMAVIGGILTLTGHGPVGLTQLSVDPTLHAAAAPILQRLLVFNIFLIGAVVAALPISTVVTERRRLVASLRTRTLAAQEARRRAEDAAAARSRFLAMMSHEMRTPLNAVAGFADVLAARPDLDGEAVRQARQIRQSSDGLLMLVEDILDFARGDDAVSLEAIDLGAVAREAATPSRADAETKGLTVRIDDHLPEQARFWADRGVLRQALHPLIANAVKFTDEGEVSIRLDRTVGGVEIRVIDTGCGVDPSARARLFEAFEQGDASVRRNHDGAGLGLALVARHARRLGGSVSVDSRAGEGSTFTLALPLARADDAPAAPSPVTSVGETPSDPDRAPAVLVVDDHPVNREIARIMLEAFGCVVVEAGDGQEAIDAVAATPFDLVLMDVRMPRVDGLEATRRIRALGPSGVLPVVAMTADAMPEDVARCLAAGMNAHMAKPINQAGLLAVVSRALAGDLPAARLSEAA
jgi:signal transduction histidine kinase/ActR/RegA family two-component response regulator